MKTCVRSIAVAFSTTFLITLTAWAADEPAGAKTPEAAFDNFRSAIKAKEFKKAFLQLTPKTQDMLLVAQASQVSRLEKSDPAKAADLQKICDKHGLKKPDSATPAGKSVEGVADKPACFAEVMQWADKNAPQLNGESNLFIGATVSDIKIEDYTATGTMKLKVEGKETSAPMMFKKIDGTWYVDMAAAKEKVLSRIKGK